MVIVVIGVTGVGLEINVRVGIRHGKEEAREDSDCISNPDLSTELLGLKHCCYQTLAHITLSTPMLRIDHIKGVKVPHLNSRKTSYIWGLALAREFSL